MNVEKHGSGTQCEKVRSMIKMMVGDHVKYDSKKNKYKFMHGLTLDMYEDTYLKIYPRWIGKHGYRWSNYVVCISYDDITDISDDNVKCGLRPINSLMIFLNSKSEVSSQIHLYYRV